MSSYLPEGLALRPVRAGDEDAVADLINAYDAQYGTGDTMSAADVRGFWRDLGEEGSADVVEDGGTMVAYVERFPHKGAFNLDGFVHPDHRGRGIGAVFVRLGEERARELGYDRVKTGTLAKDAEANDLFERSGWQLIRAFFRMAIDLAGPPAVPPVPAGLTLRTFRDGDGERFHAAKEDAFADHWDTAPEQYDSFRRRTIESESFDPTLWWLVEDGNEVAAILRATRERFGSGWVDSLGVRPPWRRRGLGELLLLTAFAEFAARGEPRVALGVDAQNPTGATQLYEKAGMHVAFRANVFQKEL